MDRDFPIKIELGNRKQLIKLQGQSLYPGSLPEQKPYPLVTGAAARAANSTVRDAQLCLDQSLDPAKVKGKILVCLREITLPVTKGRVALQAGAIGMILVNDMSNGEETVAAPYDLPAANINYRDGLTLFSYINST
ncbi:hypothetical protein MKW94_026278, partial [Papaver nudicaule]|nr:hypothetical protein [Papaver nudicaule]